LQVESFEESKADALQADFSDLQLQPPKTYAD
jgi:hypothetical protein